MVNIAGRSNVGTVPLLRTAQPIDPVAGLAPVEHHPPIGVLPNAPHQGAGGFKRARTYELAIVEFDDQGRCYARAQMNDVADRLDAMRDGGEDAIVLVFVHGWQHNAASDDPNLLSFCDVLAKTAAHERGCAKDTPPRPVMGVYVGWRGKTAYGMRGAVAATTFWRRQDAAHRVATGSVRELFGRLRHYRNSRLKRGGAALLVIAGHSFGGMIVFSALAQSLIQAASAPVGKVIPGFADLVLLANPAVEGARFLPIKDLVASDRFRQRTSPQLPVFVCVQAENDKPVGQVFPLGNFTNRLEQAWIGDLEKRCITHAIGFIDEFRTHRLAGPEGNFPFRLAPPEINHSDPFWVVAAKPEVVDGHGGVWKAPFLSFLAALIFKHVNVSRGYGHRDAGGGAPGRSAADRGPPPPASLATVFARTATISQDDAETLETFAQQIDPPCPRADEESEMR